MRRDVLLTPDAERDLAGIYGYILEIDGARKADYVLARLLDAAEKLANDAQRGSYPPELRSVGIQEYRQVFFKPYRIIYRTIGTQVVIYVIADGRRDMQSLLSRRLLGG
jgi:toxin ParE1/3/4